MLDLDRLIEVAKAKDAAVRFLRRVTAAHVQTHESWLGYIVLVHFQGFPVAIVHDDGSDESPEWMAPPPPIDPETGKKGEQVTGVELRAFRGALETHARIYLDLDYGGADALIAGLAGVGANGNGLQAGLRFRQIVGELSRTEGLRAAS